MLVCSAGITGPNKTTWEYPVDDWKRVFDINVNGLFYCNRAVVPVMLKRDYGRIVNIASIAGKEGNPNASAYSASKAAVIGLTKSLGKELAKTGIRVNCVTPAAVRTAIFDQITQQHIDFMLSKIPMGRFGTVDEIASLVCWLASEDCSFSTGRGVRRVGRAGDVLRPDRQLDRTSSRIFPMCADDSISACAFAASSSGNTRVRHGRQLAARVERPHVRLERLRQHDLALER